MRSDEETNCLRWKTHDTGSEEKIFAEFENGFEGGYGDLDDGFGNWNFPCNGNTWMIGLRITVSNGEIVVLGMLRLHTKLEPTPGRSWMTLILSSSRC